MVLTRLLKITQNRLRRQRAIMFEKRSFTISPSLPIVSFTFDDCPSSGCRNGGEILRASGVRGTFYLAMGLMNTGSDSGLLFTRDDLEFLSASGHEIGCHTFGHFDAFQVDDSEYRNSLSENHARVEALLLGVALDSFAYPFGSVPLSAKRTAGEIFSTCRGIYPGINSGTIDLNLLLANRLYSGKESLSRIKGLIDRNNQLRGWLIFYTHDVQKHPSPYGCDPEYFRSVVEYAQQSGALLLPVREAFKVLQNTDNSKGKSVI